jgi:hypothetical protein
MANLIGLPPLIPEKRKWVSMSISFQYLEWSKSATSEKNIILIFVTKKVLEPYSRMSYLNKSIASKDMR